MFSLQFTICTHNINANVCLQIVHFSTATAATLISSDRTNVETNSTFRRNELLKKSKPRYAYIPTALIVRSRDCSAVIRSVRDIESQRG